jgi:hypothetical protein
MILATISCGLPAVFGSFFACSTNTERSRATSSAGTSADETKAGLIAATCMAMSLATASSPLFIATRAPMRVPCR